MCAIWQALALERSPYVEFAKHLAQGVVSSWCGELRESAAAEKRFGSLVDLFPKDFVLGNVDKGLRNETY